MNKPRYSILIIAAFFAIYFIWGSTYLLNKIVVTEAPPLMLASIRFISAGILIFIIARVVKLDLSVNKRQFINSVIAGFLFLSYGNGMFVWALKYVDSGFAALIASSQPLFVLVLMYIIHGKKIHLKSLIGVFLGLAGMYLLFIQQDLSPGGNHFLGIVMILTCVLSWSYGSVFVAKAELPTHFLVSTGYQMLTGGILLIFGSIMVGEPWVSPLGWSPKAQLSMFLLVIFGSIVAFTAFNYLLKVVSTEKVSTSAFVNPVIALILGSYVLDEKITAQSGVAALILLTGVYFVNSRKRDF
jgi:drug/metabolite transporter (DMT)-like permease